MRLRGVAAVLSAGLACATVGYLAADPITALEAVPAPIAIPTADVARDLATERSSIAGPALAAADLAVLDPFNAVTPEAVGPSGAPVPLPSAPKVIQRESVGSLGKPAAGALLTRPVNGRTTSKFGMRFHPILRVWKLHTGLDWAVPCGTPVGAAAPGTVVKAGWAGGNGIQVKVDHGMLRGHRVVTTYNHLSLIGVRVGQKVEALDGVGRVGSTGYSTGCHMHFEVIVDGQFTDPEPWLNGNPVVVDLNAMQHSAIPSASAPAKPSPTPTVSPTPSPSVTQSPTPTATASPTATPSPTPTATPTASPTTTVTPTPSASGSPLPCPSVAPTAPASGSPTPCVTRSATPSGSPSPGASASATPTIPTTPTPSVTASAQASPTPTRHPSTAPPTSAPPITSEPSPSSSTVGDETVPSSTLESPTPSGGGATSSQPSASASATAT